MPTDLELAAAEKAARDAAPGMGGFSARSIAKACLEAAERIRMGGPRARPCPIPDHPGWTMQDCFDASRCGCADGVSLGYRAKPYVKEVEDQPVVTVTPEPPKQDKPDAPSRFYKSNFEPS